VVGDFASAIGVLRRFLQLHSDNFEARLFLAACCDHIQEASIQKQSFDLLKNLSDEDFLKIERSRICLLDRELLDIPYVNIGLYQEKVRRFPREAGNWYDLGAAYEEGGQLNKRDEAFARYFQMKPPEESPRDDDKPVSLS